MSWTLPADFVIPKGDFKRVIDGYFLMADETPAMQYYGSMVLKDLQKITDPNYVSTYGDMARVASELAGRYGIDEKDFAKYYLANSVKINDAIGHYHATVELYENASYYYNKIAEIKKTWHSPAEFFSDIFKAVISPVSGALDAIGDTIWNFIKKYGIPILVVIAVVIVGWLLFKYFNK